jgi:hypothetical protein
MSTISINWIIKQLLVKKTEGSLSDVVVTANWSCRGSNGTYSAVLTGCTEFAPPSGDFTPYPDLKPEQVLGWCFSNGVDQAAIEANVTRSTLRSSLCRCRGCRRKSLRRMMLSLRFRRHD